MIAQGKMNACQLIVNMRGVANEKNDKILCIAPYRVSPTTTARRGIRHGDDISDIRFECRGPSNLLLSIVRK